ncbi:MAG: signal peptidase I [Oscillospiraceae bacterium]|jgi:signal peptidase I|nr:signal peptidase I [Oscillospiraceae bacterium]
MEDFEIKNETGNNKEIKPVKQGFFHESMDLLETAITSVFIVGMIFTFIFRIAVVQGSSMEQTLLNNEKLIVSNLFYTPKPLDIVVIDNLYAYLFSDETETEVVAAPGIEKGKKDKYIVKRVIAVEGQTLDIDFENAVVYVDGKPIEDDFVDGDWSNDYHAFDYPITIPKGYIFVMGDNRKVSNDSRAKNIGLVDVDDVVGRCIFRVTPLKRFGPL